MDHLTFETDSRLKHVEQFDKELESQKAWLKEQEETFEKSLKVITDKQQ